MVLQNVSSNLIKSIGNIYIRQNERNGNKCAQRLYMALPRLTPQEVTAVLRANEYTKVFNKQSSVIYYDSNQLASNNPIEDTRSEAQCLLTKGTKVVQSIDQGIYSQNV